MPYYHLVFTLPHELNPWVQCHDGDPAYLGTKPQPACPPALSGALRHAWKQKVLPRLEPANVNQTLNTVMAKDWVVYSKNYLKQPDTIVRYLGRYTRKTAISESRICTVSEHHVTFDYKDYRDNKDKQMRLGGTEFLRRFFLHVLPQGFMRIRHYGFLSNWHL